MLNFIANGVKTEINGKELIINRVGIGKYYQFLSAFIKYSNANSKVLKSDYGKDYINIGIVKVEFERLKKMLKWFTNIKIDKNNIALVIIKVIEANSLPKKSSEKNETTEKDIENQFNSLVSMLVKAGYSINEALEVNNIQALILFENWKKDRISNLIDLRVARFADKTEFKKHCRELEGYSIKEASGLEVLKLLEGNDGK